MPHLTDAQRAAYEQDGFLCPVDVLTPEEAAENRALVEGLERDHADSLAQPVGAYLRVASHIATDVPLRVARDERVLDAVEGILGPDLMLWSCEYFIKEAQTDKIVSWHQDLTYWGMEGSDHEVTAWVALSDASAAAGCMKFVPGSHRQQLVPHTDTFSEDNLLSRGQEIAVEVDEANAVAAALKPGQMSLHHGRLFHASGPNTTPDRRIGLVLRFIRPDTPSDGSGKDFGVMMRGIDRHGIRSNVAPLAGDFTPAQMAMYDEVTGTQAEVLAHGLDGTDALYSGAAR